MAGRPRSRHRHRRHYAHDPGYASSAYHAGYSAGARDASRRSWPDDSRGHRKAAKLGWHRRKRKSRRDPMLRSWPDDSRGHSKASKLGWRRRRRGRRDPARNWPDDAAGHAAAARKAWRRRKATKGKRRKAKGRKATHHPRRTYSSVGFAMAGPHMEHYRGRREELPASFMMAGPAGRSWPDDSRGHSRASKKGWRRRKRSRRDPARNWPDDSRGHSLASRRGWGHRRGLRSWPDDSAGHAAAARKGWRSRRSTARLEAAGHLRRRRRSRRDYY